MRYFLLSVAIMMAFLFAAPAHAQVYAPRSIMSFADHLFEQEDYYRAITEYERLIYHYPGHGLAKQARFQIALSYFRGNRYRQAIRRFRLLAQKYPKEEVGRRSLFMLAETHYEKKEYRQAIDVFTSFLETYPGAPERDRARIRMGWSYLRQGYWLQASEEYQKLPSGSPLHKEAQGLAEGSKRYPGIPRKSPTLAGGLSAVLPGAGQLYVGRPRDAAVSFLLNGVFIWATIEAFNNDNNVAGGILLFFEIGWYLGNIYNAAGSAHKYNRSAEQEFMNTLQGKYGLSLSRDETGTTMLTVVLRF